MLDTKRMRFPLEIIAVCIRWYAAYPLSYRHLEETYIKINGQWKYFYRAVDKEGQTVDFLLSAKRDKAAAMRFFEKAMLHSDIPEKIAMDKSGANKSAIDQIIEDKRLRIIVRQVKYLNNMVEQDHRGIKR